MLYAPHVLILFFIIYLEVYTLQKSSAQQLLYVFEPVFVSLFHTAVLVRY